MKDVFGTIKLLLGLLVVLVISFALMFTYDHIGERKIESDVKLKPDYRFRISDNGKKIDTIYIYTFK